MPTASPAPFRWSADGASGTGCERRRAGRVGLNDAEAGKPEDGGSIDDAVRDRCVVDWVVALDGHNGRHAVA
jgi:hypothetical protein